MITSLRTAFLIAVLSGVVVGAAAGFLRKIVRGPDEHTSPATLYGGILAAFAFGAMVVFDRAGQFLLWEFRPISFGSVLEVTIFIVLLFALVYILYE